VNAWDVSRWCYSSREDWLGDPYQTRVLFVFAYARAATQILGSAQVRDRASVETILSFLGNGNWSMLAERRAAYLIERPDVDPQARPQRLELYDTGQLHNGQRDPESEQSAWEREIAPALGTGHSRLRVVNG
jgi:hypothetical protein